MTAPPSSRTEPVRVAIDVGPLYGHRTGVGAATAGLVEALAGRDDVRLDPFLVSFRSRPRPGDRRLPVPGIIASHLWSRVHWPKVDRWARDAEVVHGTNYVVPPTRLPSVVTVYDCWFLRHPEQASPVVRRAASRLRRAVEHGAFVHASSDATAEQVRALLATDRVATIALGPPPAPPPLSALPAPPVADRLQGHPFVLAVGTEERRKGLPLLIEAFALLASSRRDVLLVLAGAPGDDSPVVEQAIAALGATLSERVLRLGAVDEATKHWLLRRASLLAYPSLDEGFGFPILEAQLAATPVVASRVGSVAEIAGDGALLVAGRDPATLACELGRALDDGALRLTLVEAGNRNVRRFAWERTAERLAALYHSLREAGR